LTDSTRRPVRRVRFVAAVCAIVGLACAVAACDEEDNSSLELMIGDLIPLSGRLQEFGPSADKAAEIAVDQVDDAIGAVGADHVVTLVTEDDQTSPAAGVAVAQKLVNRGATCLTGSWSPAVTIATARAVSIPEGILQISPASTRDEITSLDDHGLVNRTVPPDSAAGQVIAGGAALRDSPEAFAQLAPARRRVDGVRVITPGVPDAPASNAFDDIYESTDPTDIGRRTFDAQNFDAVVLCYLAAVAAGSVDGQALADHVRAVSGPPGHRYTWQQLPDAIRALEEGKDIDYQGASGPIDMNRAGDATAGSYDVYEYRDDRLNLVDEL
jgi:ABC-type branched-subunit amino acid transport system substrate-binding protein